jgi:hypothetical protein
MVPISGYEETQKHLFLTRTRLTHIPLDFLVTFLSCFVLFSVIGWVFPFCPSSFYTLYSQEAELLGFPSAVVSKPA